MIWTIKRNDGLEPERSAWYNERVVYPILVQYNASIRLQVERAITKSFSMFGEDVNVMYHIRQALQDTWPYVKYWVEECRN